MGPALDVPALNRELDQRIAVIRRYRKMLENQRDRLEDYLLVLDARDAALVSEDFQKLEEYAHREQQVVKSVMAIQKCLEPLALMYRKLAPEGSPDIDELSRRLGGLQQQILQRNQESLQVLHSHADRLKGEIRSVRNRRSVLGGFATEEPRLCDISG